MTKINQNLIFILLLIFAACSSRNTTKSALTVEEEKKLAEEAKGEMLKDFPPVKNQVLQNYINQIGQKIVKANKLDNNPYKYTFTVVDAKMVNAFALPAGSIFITAPIIAMADSEAEVAGVIGHEIGHVTERHTAKRMYTAEKEQKKMWIFGGVGAALGGAGGYLLADKLCAKGDTACRAKYTAYGAGAGGLGGLMVQKYGFMKNSQEDELESDRVGFKYAANAGYDKNKVGDFYLKLAQMEKEAKKGQNALMSWIGDAMASHPPSNSRVKQAEKLKGEIQTQGKLVSSPEFSEMKNLARQIAEKK